ncbi:MAG: UPF0182 family protein [Terracidiphilus sp.]|jgi:uncharacterized membrane protein (UPF0182 family)
MPETINWPKFTPPQRRRRHGFLFFIAVLATLLLGSRTVISYWVDLLWFKSLGYGDVFWKARGLEWGIFAGFFILTFLIVLGTYSVLKRAHAGDLPNDHTLIIAGQEVNLSLKPVLRIVSIGGSLVVAILTGGAMAADWQTLALWWYAPRGASTMADPIFMRPLDFYLFTLPAWQLILGWLLTLGIIACVLAMVFLIVSGSTRALSGSRASLAELPLRGISITLAFLLLVIGLRVYVGRFEQLFDHHTIFDGVTYTGAHITLTGMLLVSAALVLGAAIAAVGGVLAPRARWLAAAVAPAVVCYAGVALVGWYVSSFIVKPNELVREQPYIVHNIEMTQQAYGLDRFQQREFPAETTVDATDPANNQATLKNIRLWDWHALQDTLRQIQEIRTYYDFPDIDIDRYQIDGSIREVMLAARELRQDKLPESSQNWINEKLIYTHGYGLAMNTVNGFTAEGRPTLLLSNMPVQSTVPGLNVTRPEIYFGEQTTTDVYVKTRQKEFNYPQGGNDNYASYQGNGGIELGGLLRRIFIALDRGDLAKLPFSDDVGSESRLLMRRTVRERVAALAPFLTFDQDPYIVLGDDGRMSWILDAFTQSDTYPYSTHYFVDGQSVNYMRNSVKAVVDAYDGTTTFYIFDNQDPILAAWHAVFPSLFKDASSMPTGLRKHVRYPELLLRLQAEVYGLYHMTNPEVFYNKEDQWTVATEVGMGNSGEQQTEAMQPNFVLMKLPSEKDVEFVEILPFTPLSRNNLIGWIAGRSDGEHYGTSIVYDFPKTKQVDGPLQIEARIDQNAQISGQLTLWNQQGSHVRRGTLLVIPSGRALLYAEPIYLQANRSPMPELRLVVLALQDKLAYGPTFEAALSSLFGSGVSSLSASESSTTPAAATAQAGAPQLEPNLKALIAQAGRDFDDYQQLTAAGKLGEAGQKLEALKQVIEKLNAQGK